MLGDRFGIIPKMYPVIALDLETTGLDPRRDAIIEIGAVCFDGEKIIGKWQSLINPQRSCTARSQRTSLILLLDKKMALSGYHMLRNCSRYPEKS